MSEFFTSRFQTISSYFSTQSFGFGDFGNFFSWDFWTERNLFPSSTYTLLVLIAVNLLIISLFVWRKNLKKKQRDIPVYDWPLNQLVNLIIFIIIMTLSYWFFRSQQLAYLSSRLVVLATLVVVIAWIAWIIYYIYRTARSKREAYLEKERFFRYLPKSKSDSKKKRK